MQTEQQRIGKELMPGGLCYIVKSDFEIQGGFVIKSGNILRECRDGFFAVFPDSESEERSFVRIGNPVVTENMRHLKENG